MALTVETWVEALESGRYKQANGQLRVGDAYCCLGVLCDLSGTGGWENEDYYHPIDGHVAYVPPHDVWEAVGMRTSEGEFEFDSLPNALQEELRRTCKVRLYSLANINDNRGSFALIAKVIRARPKGLFREDV